MKKAKVAARCSIYNLNLLNEINAKRCLLYWPEVTVSLISIGTLTQILK